jgi:hypothetical protein
MAEADLKKLPLSPQELMFLRRRVEELAHQPGATRKWLNAYQKLADALSALEDMSERDPDKEDIFPPKAGLKPRPMTEDAAAYE